jgi:hypothetical protein
MASLKKTYAKIVIENPYLGLIPCLKMALQKFDFDTSQIGSVFRTIPKDEYLPSERDEIIEDLFRTVKEKKTLCRT